MHLALTLKRDEVRFIDCTERNIERLEAIYTLLFEDSAIMFGKMVKRLVEPGVSSKKETSIGVEGLTYRSKGCI
jgi:hypothetical protein